MVSSVTEQLNNTLSNPVDKFETIFKKCEEMAYLNNVEIANTRTVQRQTMRSNVEYDSPDEYYRRCPFISFLDGLLHSVVSKVKQRPVISKILMLKTG